MASTVHAAITYPWVRLPEKRIPHYVSPFPSFFDRLASLSEDTARAARNLDRRTPASDAVLASFFIQEHRRVVASKGGETHVNRLLSRDWPRDLTWREATEAILLSLQRTADGRGTDEDRVIVSKVYARGKLAAKRLVVLAELCRRLARVSRTQLEGRIVDQEQQEFLDDVGRRLAELEHYVGKEWFHPQDNVPRVSVVAGDGKGEFLHVGVARPREMYIVLPHAGGSALYRGAAGTYREFVDSRVMDGATWVESSRMSKPLF
jgi:hypothetical protein